jgi:hypothetical protein
MFPRSKTPQKPGFLILEPHPPNCRGFVLALPGALTARDGGEMEERRKKGGRPKLKNDECKSIAIGFRCTQSDCELLKSKADQVGLTVGEYCREAALNKKKLVQTAPRINVDVYSELKRIGVNLNQAVKYGYIHDDGIIQQINRLRLWILGVQDDSKY